MHEGQASKRVLPVSNLREFFKDALHGALEKRRLSVEDQTEHYVVNVLTLFSRSEALYDTTSEGARLKPLVVMLSEALEARSTGDRNRGLQRLGDVSLFIAGFFAQSFARKLIDIDYHIAMGGRAYAALADTMSRGKGRVLGQVFNELARNFQPMVDALNELSETLLHSLGQGHSAVVRDLAEDRQPALLRHSEASRCGTRRRRRHCVRALIVCY